MNNETKTSIDTVKLQGLTLDFDYSQEYFLAYYREFEGCSLISFEYKVGQVFTLARFEDEDDSSKEILRLCPRDDLEYNAAMTSKIDVAMHMALGKEQTNINVTILPKECFQYKNFDAFSVGDSVVFINSIDISDMKTTQGGSRKAPFLYDCCMKVDYATIVSKDKDSMRVELEAIPGQIELLTNPQIVGSKLDIIPFLN